VQSSHECSLFVGTDTDVDCSVEQVGFSVSTMKILADNVFVARQVSVAVAACENFVNHVTVVIVIAIVVVIVAIVVVHVLVIVSLCEGRIIVVIVVLKVVE